MGIFFPDCTKLCVSGNHRWASTSERADAIDEIRWLLNLPIPKIAVENPIGVLSTAIRRPDQIIQPFMFGHDASKATCLWLKNLLPLQRTKFIEPRIVDGRPRWANQCDSGQNRLGPSPTRAMDRARTYQGIADAMAEQWTAQPPDNA